MVSGREGKGEREGREGRERGRERGTQPALAIAFIPNMGVKKFSWMFQFQQILHEQKNHPYEFSSD